MLAGYSPTPAEEMIQEERNVIQNHPSATPKVETGNECPLHPGTFFEFIDGYQGKPGEWKHKNGLWPDGPDAWAGQTKWCRENSKEVKAVTPQPEPTIDDMFEEIEAVEEDDKPY